MNLSDIELAERYSLGESCANLATLCECSETKIYYRLKKLGIKIRNRSEANQIFPDSVFVILYNLGLSSSQTGELLGVDPSTVTKRLHKLRFPLRSRNVARRIRYTDKEFREHFMAPGVIESIMEMAS